MKKNSSLQVSLSGPAPEVCAANPLNVITLEQTMDSGRPQYEMIYRCKNCGKPLSSYDIINFYGLPACPVCFNAAAPFEVELVVSEMQGAAVHC
jgi:hypothetical protein